MVKVALINMYQCMLVYIYDVDFYFNTEISDFLFKHNSMIFMNLFDLVVYNILGLVSNKLISIRSHIC